MDCEFVPATRDHAEYIAPRMRNADKLELQAFRGDDDTLTPLLDGLDSPDPTYTAIVWGEPVCMFGTGPSPAPECGFVWLLGTNRVPEISRIFLRHSRPWVIRLHCRYPVLMNCCDKRNAVHIRWLRWCGFTFIRQLPDFGEARVPFREFVRLHHV